MQRTHRAFLALVVVSLLGLAAPAAQETTPNPDAVALSVAITQVKAALDEYQKNLGTGADALPPLAAAEFDFKTTATVTTGGTISLFIFKFGATHEKDVVNEVTYTYTVPKPAAPVGGVSSHKPPPTLKDTLAQAIQSAAVAVKASGTVGKLVFSKLTVNIAYSVKVDGTLGAGGTIALVTVGFTADKSRNDVQSVKLVFGQ